MAFCDNKDIIKISLPDSIEKIGEYCFSGCERWEGTLTLPKNLKELGVGAFHGCIYLSGNLTIPDGVTVIPSNAFSESYFHGELVFPEKAEYIGNYAFYDTFFSGTVTIPDFVIFLGDHIFYYCDQITRVNVSNQVTFIQKYTFNATGFQEVYIPRSVTRIADDAFWSKEVKIHGYGESYAEQYAKDNGFPFVVVEALEATPIPTVIPTPVLQSKQIRVWIVKGKEAVIQWEPVSQALQYVVFRSGKKDGKYKKSAVLHGKITHYLDGTTKRQKVYYYKVKAIYRKKGGKESSDFSNVVKTKRTSLQKPKVSMKKSRDVLEISFLKYEGGFIDLYVGKNGGKKKLVPLKSKRMKKKLRLQYLVKSKNVYLFIRTYAKKGTKKIYSKFTKKKIN